MNKLNLKQLLASVLVGAALVLTGWATTLLGPAELSKQNFGNVSNSFGTPINVVGTLVGTTTTGVSFYARAASNTYPFALRDNESNVVLKIQTLATSTGPNGFVTFSILSSNTAQCDTASSTYSVVNNNVVIGDIKWADAANHLKNAAAVTSLSTGTTTIGYSHNSTQLGKELILTDVNARCLALEVAASSTVLQVSAMAR